MSRECLEHHGEHLVAEGAMFKDDKVNFAAMQRLEEDFGRANHGLVGLGLSPFAPIPKVLGIGIAPGLTHDPNTRNLPEDLGQQGTSASGCHVNMRDFPLVLGSFGGQAMEMLDGHNNELLAPNELAKEHKGEDGAVSDIEGRIRHTKVGMIAGEAVKGHIVVLQDVFGVHPSIVAEEKVVETSDADDAVIAPEKNIHDLRRLRVVILSRPTVSLKIM